jgi:hypothetical protein
MRVGEEEKESTPQRRYLRHAFMHTAKRMKKIPQVTFFSEKIINV